MSPAHPKSPAPRPVELDEIQIATRLGDAIRLARARRGWTLAQMAEKASLSRAGCGRIEQGRPALLGTYLRLAAVLGLDSTFELQPKRRRDRLPDEDPVHAALGELEAGRFRHLGRDVKIDEPYQFYQFSGRGDVVVIDGGTPDLLHVENRTRLPNVGETAGSFNAKVRWLSSGLVVPGDGAAFRSETHVLVLLWSAEVLHTLRLRTETFRALAPGGALPFERWWRGEGIPPGTHRGLVVVDPVDRPGRRRWIDLEAALTARPRYAGYAEALDALRSTGAA